MDTPNDTRRFDGLARTARRHHQFPVISGNPASGKTRVALAIAAALSNGHSPGSKNTFNGAWYWELPQSPPPPVQPD